MSERLDDDDLLELLNRKEEEAGHYVWGELASKRDTSLREYYRMPYGNEQDGCGLTTNIWCVGSVSSSGL